MPSSKILLAVSGGVDSMVMCKLFSTIENTIGIAHVNHQTRGKYSDDEARFVEDYARTNQIAFYSVSKDLKTEAHNSGENFQSYARSFRYEWFEMIRKKEKYDYIATAHHRDDAIETALFHFSRGTGLTGMTGIRSKRAFLIRPLLFTHRGEIISYAKSMNIAWRDDHSNQMREYARNKIRLDVLPDLDELNPNFRANAYRTILNLSEARNFLDYYLQKIKEEAVIKDAREARIRIHKILDHPFPAYLLFEILKDFGFNAEQCAQIIQHKQVGKIVYSQECRLLTDREEWILRPRDSKAFEPIEIHSEGVFHLGKKGTIKIELVRSFMINDSNNIEFIAFEKLRFPLTVRNWIAGDSFKPLGMKGRQKVQDFLTNNKLSRIEKENVLILESGEKICWIIGRRLDERFKIRDHNAHCWRIEYLPIQDE